MSSVCPIILAMKQKTLICVLSHKDVKTPDDPIYVPIEVGACKREDHFYPNLDNTGDNISEKNDSYCELTGIYWAYKNNEYEYFGTAHYRRYLMNGFFSGKNLDNVLNEEKIEKLLSKYDILVPSKIVMIIHTNYYHYVIHHKREALDITEEIIKTDYPSFYKSYKKVMRRVWGHYFNMFVTRKDLAQDYLDWLFELLGKVESRIDLDEYVGQDKRVFGYIAELMLDTYIDAKKLRYKDVRFANMSSHYIWNMFKGALKNKKEKKRLKKEAKKTD